MQNEECRIAYSTVALARRFDGCHEDRDQFIGFLHQVCDPTPRDPIRFDEQFEPIGGLVQLLKAAVHLTAELCRRPGAACLAVLCPDRSSASAKLSPHDHRLRITRQRRAEPNDPEGETL